MKKIGISLLCVQLCLIAMILSSSGLAMPRLAEELGFTSVQQGSMVIIWIALAGFACSPFYPLLTIWITRLTGEKKQYHAGF